MIYRAFYEVDDFYNNPKNDLEMYVFEAYDDYETFRKILDYESGSRFLCNIYELGENYDVIRFLF